MGSWRFLQERSTWIRSTSGCQNQSPQGPQTGNLSRDLAHHFTTQTPRREMRKEPECFSKQDCAVLHSCTSRRGVSPRLPDTDGHGGLQPSGPQHQTLNQSPFRPRHLLLLGMPAQVSGRTKPSARGGDRGPSACRSASASEPPPLPLRLFPDLALLTRTPQHHSNLETIRPEFPIRGVSEPMEDPTLRSHPRQESCHFPRSPLSCGFLEDPLELCTVDTKGRGVPPPATRS